jgi:deazaflavin-dependent oxidoreductase (nitroreductase family)
VSEHFLYLTTMGRKSGLPRTIEIWFVERGGRYYVVSERREQSNWVQNIQRDAHVEFAVGTRADRTAVIPATRGSGRIVREGAEPDLARAVRSLMNAKYDWSDGLIVELSAE